MTEDGAFRIVAVSLNQTTSEIARVQKIVGSVAETMGELVAAAVLMRETIAPGQRVQLAMRQALGRTFIADSRPDGSSRGLVQYRKEKDEESLLQVSYHRTRGSLHQSTVTIDGNGDVSSALMQGLQQSEQIYSTAAVAATSAGGGVIAVGYLVQVLPEVDRNALEEMTSRLAELPALVPATGTASPEELVQLLLADTAATELASQLLRFECGCSRDRVLATLTGLAQDEIAMMCQNTDDVEVRCDACGTAFQFQVEEIAGLLRSR
jgi:molecular chaperone Hsp33